MTSQSPWRFVANTEDETSWDPKKKAHGFTGHPWSLPQWPYPIATCSWCFIMCFINNSSLNFFDAINHENGFVGKGVTLKSNGFNCLKKHFLSKLPLRGMPHFQTHGSIYHIVGWLWLVSYVSYIMLIYSIQYELLSHYIPMNIPGSTTQFNC